MPSRTGTRQAWRLPTPSMVTRQSKHTPIRQYGARGDSVTGVVRKWSTPAASMAPATVSPRRARISLPSTFSETVSPVSPSRLNMEPPRTEGGDQRLVERAAGDHRRHAERVIGAQRHAGMAAQHEGAG